MQHSWRIWWRNSAYFEGTLAGNNVVYKIWRFPGFLCDRATPQVSIYRRYFPWNQQSTGGIPPLRVSYNFSHDPVLRLWCFLVKPVKDTPYLLSSGTISSVAMLRSDKTNTYMIFWKKHCSWLWCFKNNKLNQHAEHQHLIEHTWHPDNVPASPKKQHFPNNYG